MKPRVELEGVGESGQRVANLVIRAYELADEEDVPIQDVLDDLILAAASIMFCVHKQTGAPICPPMSGRPTIDGARHAISLLASSMLGVDDENPS